MIAFRMAANAAHPRKFYRESSVRAMKETDQFQRGVAHFNAREFFEAHEVWEEIWLAVPEPEKTFLQGMIQIAAAFHHHGRGNMRGMKSLLAAGLAKINGFPGDHREIALDRFRGEAGKWMDALAADKDLGPRKLPRIRPAGPSPPLRPERKKKRGG